MKSPLHLKLAEFANVLVDSIAFVREHPTADAALIQASVLAHRDALDAAIAEQWLALENCRMLAQRCPKESWAQNVLRFCESAGSVPTILGR